MPEIVENAEGKFCLEGYGDADACYDSREEADAARAKLSGMEDKALPPPKKETTTDDAAPNDAPPEGEPEQEGGATAVVDVPANIRQLVLRIGAQVADAADATAKALGLARKQDEATGFKVQGNHWLAVWSNNFKDRDGELFPERAIDAYVSRVDNGMTPLPELWVWHAGKQSAIGAADWVARHGHFLMAAGQFYGGEAAQAAKAYYARHAKDTGISHGFTFPVDQFDGKIYQAFNTFEISLLPRGSEANWYTSLEGVKAMALKPDQMDYLKAVWGEEHAKRILADWDKRGKALEELGVEFKDFADPAASVADANKQAVEKADKAFGDLLGEVLESSSVPVTAALEAVQQVKAANAKVSSLEAQVATLAEEVKAIREGVPRASQSKATEITQVVASHLSDTLQKELQEQKGDGDGDGFFFPKKHKQPAV